MTNRIQTLTIGLRAEGVRYPAAKQAIEDVIASPKSMNTLADILERCAAK